MFLRWIVSNYLRETAQRTMRDVARDALSGDSARTRAATDSLDEPSGCDIAVLFALPIESSGFVDLLTELKSVRCDGFTEHTGLAAGKQVLVVETGVGQAAAAKATADVLAFHRPKWLISAGFAGGLRDDIRPGHLLLLDQSATADGQPIAVDLQCDRDWLATAKGVHSGKLLTVDELVRTTAEKLELAGGHQAIACDMETYAVAAACQGSATKFLAIRIVTDAVDDTLPVEIDRLMRQTTLAGKMGAAAGAILGRPSVAKELWTLRGLALKSSDRLAKFLLSTLPQLP